jgi:hypothetical protein
MATKWGIVGCGMIANDFVAAMQTIENWPEEHNVVACAARSLPRAQEFAKKFGITNAYGSYLELAQDPEVGEKRSHQTIKNDFSVLKYIKTCEGDVSNRSYDC